MAKNSKVTPEVFSGLLLSITSDDIKKCRAVHVGALEANIKGGGAPADGAILTLIKTIAALDALIPSDDPAGRGLDVETDA